MYNMYLLDGCRRPVCRAGARSYGRIAGAVIRSATRRLVDGGDDFRGLIEGAFQDHPAVGGIDHKQRNAELPGCLQAFPTLGVVAGNVNFDRCDMRLIQRMIANLLDNAIKYTPANGFIDVGLRITDDQSVLISVKDTGIGISKQDLAYIFERFYRCDPSRSQAGTGLGLSFARAGARAHDGDITVISAPDQGSAFTVTLPRGQHG